MKTPNMPSKKKKYNARFPAGRIKKIMQTDEDVGKVAQAVPVIISRTLELFVESLLNKAMEITCTKKAKTLTPSHMKQCILSESRFDFLKDLVKDVPDVSSCDSEDGAAVLPSPVPIHNLQPSNSIPRTGPGSGIRQSQEGYGVLNTRDDLGQIPTTAQLTAAVSNRINANFYKETGDASISNIENYVPQPVHPACTFVYPSGPESHELEDSGGENEEVCRQPVVINPPFMQPQMNSAVDEDYDT